MTESDNLHEYSVDSGSAAPARMAETRPLYWSVRRELWENRFIYIAPLIVAAFVLFGSFISLATAPHRMRNLPTANQARQNAMLVRPFDVAPAPIMLATLIVGLFYCLDALYGERRDRSILFWKSLPVSDLTTVISKAAIPLVVLPLIAYALSVATQLILLVLSTPILLGNRVNPARLWGEFRFFQGLIIMLYGLVVHALWFAPIYGWLMLVSAWARRAPFLWAVMPPLAVSALERMAFSSSFFMHMLQYRVIGAMRLAFAFKPRGEGHDNFDRLSQLDPGRFLSAPGLWIGLILAAAFFAVAVRLRRNREPI